MADADLIKLYSERILALAANMPHSERLDAPQASANKRSPLCGSTVTIDVAVEDGRLSGLGMDVKACALGQASAAVLAKSAIGLTRDQIADARDALKAMLKEGADAPLGAFAELEVLTPAKEYKNRHASILLAWEATVEAMDKAQADASAIEHA